MREKVGAVLCFSEQGSSSTKEPQLLCFPVAFSPQTRIFNVRNVRAPAEGQAPGQVLETGVNQMGLALRRPRERRPAWRHPYPRGRCSRPQDGWVGRAGAGGLERVTGLEQEFSREQGKAGNGRSRGMEAEDQGRWGEAGTRAASGGGEFG